ncbi:MAG: FG-GAP repeat domain-containing protein, partial [Planctomycetota bacterium]|jgi:hypothetical protein
VATSFLTGEVALLLNDGKGGLKVRERFASGRGAARVVVADHDGDGRDDIVVANRLADTVTLFVSRREATRQRRARPPRATVCDEPTRSSFKLLGLTDPYVFGGEFRLPAEILDPSGLGFLGGVANSQLVLVSDKASALFRVTVDRSRTRLLVGPPIPLRGLERQRLDLEAVAFDRRSGNLFLACEADSSIASSRRTRLPSIRAGPICACPWQRPTSAAPRCSTTRCSSCAACSGESRRWTSTATASPSSRRRARRRSPP